MILHVTEMRRSGVLFLLHHQSGQRLLSPPVTRLAHSDQGRVGGKERKKVTVGQSRSQIDRLVEDLISESIAAGEFENLKGAGEPLPERREFNPHGDPTTNKMNEILVETVGHSLSDGGSECDRNVCCRVSFLTGFSYRKIFARGKL